MKYAHSFVVFGFIVFIFGADIHSSACFTHIPHGNSTGTGAIICLPWCQKSDTEEY